MTESQDLLLHYRRQRGWTRDLVEAVPDEHFDWAPAADAFSCGGLVRHLIQAEIFWRRLLAMAVDGEAYDPVRLEGDRDERMRSFRQPNLRSSGSPKLGSTFAECLASWEPIQAATEELIEGLTSEQLSEVGVRHPLTGLEASLREFLLVMFEHEAHHRGQLSAYLKTLGVEQPTTLWS